MSQSKIIEIPENEFQDLLNKYEQCRADREKLLKAISANNEIIDDYNKKISTDKTREQG